MQTDKTEVKKGPYYLCLSDSDGEGGGASGGCDGDGAGGGLVGVNVRGILLLVSGAW